MASLPQSKDDLAAGDGSPDLVTLVIDAHGGMERWNKIASIEVSFNLSGGALARKGYSNRYHPIFSIDTKKTKVVMQGVGSDARKPDDRLIYTPERVWIEDKDGTIISSRDNPYDAFTDHSATTPWDDLHLVCFGGYAFHNYLSFPFLLRWPGFVSREVAIHKENDETWRVLEVIFPDHYPAHSKKQWFYFDKEFRLRRLDYVAFAFKVPAAHYCFDYKDVSGIKVPMLRRVVVRKPGETMVDGEDAPGGWPWLGAPTSFLLDLYKVKVRDVGGTEVSSGPSVVEKSTM